MVKIRLMGKKEDMHAMIKSIYQIEVIYALSEFLRMSLSWMAKQSRRAVLFQEGRP